MALPLLATTDTQIIRLVEALYNQRPGYTFLSNFRTYITENSVDAFANALGGNFASSTDAELAATVTANLGLTGDALTAGNAYLEGQFAAYPAARGKVVLDAMNVLSTLESHAVYGAAATLFNADTVASLTYSSVVANTTVTTSDAAADVVAGSTFTLTTSVDTSAIAGSAGNDTYNALSTTLTTGDTVDAGAGTDTINLTQSIAAATAIGGFTLTNFEVLNVTLSDGNTGADHALTLNMLNAAMSTVQLSGLSATTEADGLVLTNLAAGTALSMSSATDLALTATYVATATVGTTALGTAETVNVSLSGVSSTAAGDSILTVGTGFETMALSSNTSASALGDLIFLGTTLNITGDANLTIKTGLDESLDTIDASAFTGALSIITVDDTTTENALVGTVDVADITITGGSGNDTIDVSANGTANEININAGAGDDTVTIGAALTNAGATIAGDVLVGGEGTDTLISDVDFVDAAAGFTGVTTVTGVSGFEKLSLNGFAAEINTVNTANISADIVQVNLITATAAATTLNMGSGTQTVGIGGVAAVLAGDALTVDASGTGTSDALTISNINVATGTAQWGDEDTSIIVTDFETVTIDTGSYTTATAQLVDSINVGTNALVLTGSNGLTTKATTGIITAATIDASALTGALIMNAAAATGVTSITGGSAADTLVGDASSTISGGDGNDTITGGSGNDTLNGGAGNDTIVTGAGTDTVNGGAGDDTLSFVGNLSALDVIDGGEGTDTLSINNASIGTIKAMTISEANAFNANMTNVEKVSVSDAWNQTTFDMGYLAGVTNLTLNAITGAESIVGFTSGSTITATDDLGAILTLSVSGSATSTTDALTMVLAESADVDYDSIVVADVETLTINVTEVTASSTIRAATLGVATSQQVGGAAQTLNVIGTEALTIDTAVTMGTIDASGMTVVATTDAGFTMSSSAIVAQTITGSGKVDTIYGSTKADTIDAGAGNDIIYANTGADTIDGGAGTDTLHTTGMVSTSIEGTGTGTSTGVVINMGTTSVTLATIFGATGSQYLGAGDTAVGAGQMQYIYNSESSLNSGAVNTLSNIENITLAANGINYVVGTSTANIIVGGSGADTIIAGAGNDFIQAGDGIDSVTGGTGNDTYAWDTNGDADVIVEAALGGTDTIILTDARSLSGLVYGITSAAATANASLAQIEQLVVDTGTTGSVLAAQVTGLTLAINELASGTADLAILIAAAGDLDISNLTFATFNYIDSTGTSVAGDAFDDGADTITITGDGDNTIVGSSIKDTIDVIDGANTVTGGLGADDMTGGAGVDQYIIANADTGNSVATADIIRGFATTADKIDLAGAAGSGSNYSEDDADAADFAAALAQADTELDGTVLYSFQTDGTNGWLFYDADGTANGTTALDAVVSLIGIDESEIAYGDIIA